MRAAPNRLSTYSSGPPRHAPAARLVCRPGPAPCLGRQGRVLVEAENVFAMVGVVDGNVPVDAPARDHAEVRQDERRQANVVLLLPGRADLGVAEAVGDELRLAALLAG